MRALSHAGNYVPGAYEQGRLVGASVAFYGDPVGTTAHGVPVWCGGMLETGIGRAANVALAALPGFTLPGDTSGSRRYFATDITEPFVLADGHLDVPTGPGLGIKPLPDVLKDVTTSAEWIAL